MFNLASVSQCTKPFPHWIIPDFINKGAANALVRALCPQPFNRKDSDLFQFFQGADLKKSKKKALREFYQCFSNMSFILQIASLTKKKLKSIDMSPFIYRDTDYLLPHDDRLEGRKIAYILYLKSCSSGGNLEFFKGNRLVKSIRPVTGTLILFEVSSKSVHQVSEIISGERISLAGWFHDK